MAQWSRWLHRLVTLIRKTSSQSSSKVHYYQKHGHENATGESGGLIGQLDKDHLYLGIADNPRYVALAGDIFRQNDAARSELSDLPVADPHFELSRKLQDELRARRRMPVSNPLASL